MRLMNIYYYYFFVGTRERIVGGKDEDDLPLCNCINGHLLTKLSEKDTRPRTKHRTQPVENSQTCEVDNSAFFFLSKNILKINLGCMKLSSKFKTTKINVNI